MLLIQCTKKLEKELNATISKKEMADDPLYSWHAHLFFFNRRKYVMVMNDKSRYNFVIGPLRKEEFKRLGVLVKENLIKMLTADGFDQNLIVRYIDNCLEVSYGPTSERSIISQINDQIWITKINMESQISSGQELNLIVLNQQLNQTPMLKLRETYPVQAMKKEMNPECEVVQDKDSPDYRLLKEDSQLVQDNELAVKKWLSVPTEFRKKIETSVFCASCGVTTITNYHIGFAGGNIALRGNCQNCGRKVARIID